MHLLPEFVTFKTNQICYLNECITFEIKLVDKICNFVSSYRPPNQSEDYDAPFGKRKKYIFSFLTKYFFDASSSCLLST